MPRAWLRWSPCHVRRRMIQAATGCPRVRSSTGRISAVTFEGCARISELWAEHCRGSLAEAEMERPIREIRLCSGGAGAALESLACGSYRASLKVIYSVLHA